MKILFVVFVLLASSAVIAQQSEDTFVPPTVCHTGDYISPASEGEGYVMNVLPNGSATLYFYTYDENRLPTFVSGLLNARTPNDCIRGTMFYSFNGETFSDQNPENVMRTPIWETTVCMVDSDKGLIVFKLIDDPDTVEDESETFLLRDFVRLTPKHEELCND